MVGNEGESLGREERMMLIGTTTCGRPGWLTRNRGGEVVQEVVVAAAGEEVVLVVVEEAAGGVDEGAAVDVAEEVVGDEAAAVDDDPPLVNVLRHTRPATLAKHAPVVSPTHHHHIRILASSHSFAFSRLCIMRLYNPDRPIYRLVPSAPTSRLT